MMNKFKPWHYLSALALGAEVLTCDDLDHIYAWVRIKGYWYGCMLHDEAGLCAWKFLESPDRLSEFKSDIKGNAALSIGIYEFATHGYFDRVDLPDGESMDSALFYLQQILPNVEWGSKDGLGGWEISSERLLCIRLCFTRDFFYVQTGTHHNSCLDGLFDALRWIYLSLIPYQFEPIGKP